MSALQILEIHAALNEALTGVQAAGQFRTVALADSRGLAWAVNGPMPAPDQLASIPSLLSRAFADRQPLLRFFSEKVMRFEYRSDTLSYVKQTIEGAPAETSYTLDVPGSANGKETGSAADFVVAWNDEFLVLRPVTVNGQTWCLLGLASNPVTARAALAKGASGFVSLLESADRSASSLLAGDPDAALHTRVMTALESFRAAAPDVQMAAVTSKDGFVVAALEGGTMEADMVAPLMGHSFLAIQESTQRLCGDTECVMLRMEEGVLLARELTPDLLLAAVVSPTACTGLVLSAFEKAGATLRDALKVMAVPEEVSEDCEVATI